MDFELEPTFAGQPCSQKFEARVPPWHSASCWVHRIAQVLGHYRASWRLDKEGRVVGSCRNSAFVVAVAVVVVVVIEYSYNVVVASFAVVVEEAVVVAACYLPFEAVPFAWVVVEPTKS